MNKSCKKVFVGLSGGVDSAVSAYLLQQQGYDVHGVFIQTWTPQWMECGWREDRRDAMRVAIHLGIPFHDLDLSKEYKEGVADYMIAEYRAGRTPNPDVMCNRKVKFGGFLRYALSCGADYVATGHYAQISVIPAKAGVQDLKEKRYVLKKGADSTKDQSYFLWTLAQEQLKHVLFPVGNLPKSETRKIAEHAGLPVARKKDSQGICFLGSVDMEEFLSHYIEHEVGDVLDVEGNKVGTHTGVWFVTLGQRFAGDVTSEEYRGTPLYVVSKDIERNQITVSRESNMFNLPSFVTNQDAGTDNQIQINQIIVRQNISIGDKYTAQIRYHGELHDIEVVAYDELGAAATIRFVNGAPLAAPGQSVVLYDDDICIGGGVVA